MADDEVVFVTSANLTEAALDRNLEVGPLVRDRAMAAALSSHFQANGPTGVLSRGAIYIEAINHGANF